MSYKMLELTIPKKDEDIFVQEVWYKNERLTKKNAIKWFHEQLESYDIKKVPEKYLLSILTFNGSLKNNRVISVRDIVNTL